MNRFKLLLIAVSTLSFVMARAAEPSGASMNPAPIVFFDIAGPDTAKLAAFYANVFGWAVKPDGRFEAPVIGTTLGATLRTEPAEKVIYVGVSDVTATLAEITKNGGSIAAPRFEVPGVVVLGLFRDPAGNRMGLVEMKDGKAKVP